MTGGASMSRVALQWRRFFMDRPRKVCCKQAILRALPRASTCGNEEGMLSKKSSEITVHAVPFYRKQACIMSDYQFFSGALLFCSHNGIFDNLGSHMRGCYR